MNSPLVLPAAPHRRPPRSLLGRASLGLRRILVPALLLLALDCSREEPETGGETHFLRLCEASGTACGPHFECVCGACSRACDDDDACAAYPNAICREPARSNSSLEETSCGEGDMRGVCEVLCIDDDDCAPLSKEHSCREGVCRLEPPEDTGGAPICAEAPVPAEGLVILGDSFLATTREVVARLEELARDAGFLEAEEAFRDHSRLTENSLAFPGEGLRAQYEDARAAGPVQLAILQGGGADVLLGSCESPDPSCPLVVEAAAALSSLFEELASDGVRSVVFLGYPDPVDAGVRARMDALRSLLVTTCADAPLPCYWVELRDVFSGRYEEYVSVDGLNPTTAGSNATASAVWERMRRECLAP